MTEKIPQTEIMQQMRYGQLVNITGEISEQCVILFRTEIASARNARYLALCLDHLKENWTRKYQFSPGIVFPGDGYFYCLERVNDSKTSPVKIIRLDEQGNDLPKTVISREYSSEWKVGDEPYYPVNDSTNQALYEQYTSLAAKEDHVIFGGRLGSYKYYDMDQVIDAALKKADELIHL